MSKTLHSQGQIALINSLIEERKALGMSQSDLAERLKCHQSLVARIETGQRRIDVVELVVLARALETEPASIMRNISGAVPDNAKI